MPVYLRDQDVTAVEWFSACPGNPVRDRPYISELIVINDSDTGLPVAVMDAAEITAVRTAAESRVSFLLGYGERACTPNWPGAEAGHKDPGYGGEFGPVKSPRATEAQRRRITAPPLVNLCVLPDVGSNRTLTDAAGSRAHR